MDSQYQTPMFDANQVIDTGIQNPDHSFVSDPYGFPGTFGIPSALPIPNSYPYSVNYYDYANYYPPFYQYSNGIFSNTSFDSVATPQHPMQASYSISPTASSSSVSPVLNGTSSPSFSTSTSLFDTAPSTAGSSSSLSINFPLSKIRKCSNCSTTKSTRWRNVRSKEDILCNTCFMYKQKYNKARPTNVVENYKRREMKIAGSSI